LRKDDPPVTHTKPRRGASAPLFCGHPLQLNATLCYRLSMTKTINDAEWQKMKTDFIEGFLDESGERVFPSYKDLGERYGCHKSTVGRKARDESWQDEKNKTQTLIEEKVKEGRVENIVSERVDFDTRCTGMAHDVLDRVVKMLDEAVSLSEAESAMRTLAVAQKIGKLAVGDATEINKVSADVSAPESYRELLRELGELGRQKASHGSHTIQ